MRIVLYMSEPWEASAVSDKLTGHDVVRIREPLNKKNLQRARDADIITAFVDFPLRKEQLDALPNLKMIATRSTGYDHIDLEECGKRGIVVSTVPFYGENTVAEYAMALLLSLSRKVHLSYERTTRGDFTNDGLRGFDLKGRTMGIIGGGHIGQHTARMAKGFEMNVQVADVHPQEDIAEKIGFTYVEFDDLLATSDVISIHVPLMPSTYHLINLDNIGKIKKGCILINTARGPIVDTSAIVKGLEDGILGGAGLDVIEEERDMHHEEAQLLQTGYFDQDEIDHEKVKTIIENHVLLTYDNVIIAAHNAVNTRGAFERISHTTLQNIAAFIDGTPENVVEKKA